MTKPWSDADDAVTLDPALRGIVDAADHAMRGSRTMIRLSTLTLVALALVVSACATASHSSRREVAGAFDDESGKDYDGRGEGYGGGGGGGADGDAAMTVAESAPRADVGGLFGNFKKSAPMRAPMSGAAAPASPPPPPPPPPPPDGKPRDVDNDATPDKVDDSGATKDPNKEPEASGPRLVIYKGNLTVMVTVVDAAVEKLSARAKELGGYVEEQNANGGSNNATLTMRIPAEKFYDVVNELGTYGQVTQKNISAQDVTKQVFDIELRMETAEKSRARLLELLKQATKMEEILQIENEVRRLTQEIEGMKGELRFLKDQVSMSTLTVTFYSNAPPPTNGPTRTRSRFDWINQVGIESVLYNF